MKRAFYLAVFFFCTCLAKASDTDFSSDGSGEPHPDYTVDAGHLARLPRWSLEDGTPPPLELNDALQLVRASVQKQLPGMDWQLRQAALRWKRDPKDTIAYYEFRVDYRSKGAPDSEQQSWEIIVLMDGTVLASPAPKG